jgi:hypothetical protein
MAKDNSRMTGSHTGLKSLISLLELLLLGIFDHVNHLVAFVVGTIIDPATMVIFHTAYKDCGAAGGQSVHSGAICHDGGPTASSPPRAAANTCNASRGGGSPYHGLRFPEKEIGGDINHRKIND